MKKFVITLIALLVVFSAFSQTEKTEVVINSLSFLDKQLHLNFEKAGQYILVVHNGDEYVVDKYRGLEKSTFTRIRIVYTLRKISDKQYSFSLEWSSKYNGSFSYDNSEVQNLKYVKASN